MSTRRNPSKRVAAINGWLSCARPRGGRHHLTGGGFHPEAHAPGATRLRPAKGSPVFPATRLIRHFGRAGRGSARAYRLPPNLAPADSAALAPSLLPMRAFLHAGLPSRQIVGRWPLHSRPDAGIVPLLPSRARPGPAPPSDRVFDAQKGRFSHWRRDPSHLDPGRAHGGDRLWNVLICRWTKAVPSGRATTGLPPAARKQSRRRPR